MKLKLPLVHHDPKANVVKFTLVIPSNPYNTCFFFEGKKVVITGFPDTKKFYDSISITLQSGRNDYECDLGFWNITMVPLLNYMKRNEAELLHPPFAKAILHH